MQYPSAIISKTRLQNTLIVELLHYAVLLLNKLWYRHAPAEMSQINQQLTFTMIYFSYLTVLVGPTAVNISGT